MSRYSSSEKVCEKCGVRVGRLVRIRGIIHYYCVTCWK